MEIWKSVVGFEGYYSVSNTGIVKADKRTLHNGQRRNEKVLSPSKKYNGYRQVSLCRNGTTKYVSIHILVLEAFVGPKPDGCEAMHLDGNRSNNSVDNLAWGTHKENMSHQRKHGTALIGERHWKARLTEDQIRQIRNDDRSQTVIAKEYGVLQCHISDIKNRVRWGHVV